MKVRRLRREWPTLYKGKYSVPQPVEDRLAVAESHLLLAEGAMFNAKVDSLYLVIDNTLSAIVIAREGALSTRVHQKKIEKLFKHLGRRANIRRIERKHFDKFYALWNKCRYELYMPTWLELKEMSSFTQHLFRFGITEIARSMKSDEVLLANKVHDSVGLFFSDTIGEFVGEVHDQRQEEAEEAGEVYGSKLERKFLNPWLYADVTLFADRPEVIRTVDTDARINEMLRGTVKSWDELINRIQWKNLKRLTSKIASSRTKESVQKESAQDVVSRATEDPDFLKFRLALTMVFDSSEPKETLGFWAKIIGMSLPKSVQDQRKPARTPWENLAEHQRLFEQK